MRIAHLLLLLAVYALIGLCLLSVSTCVNHGNR